MSDISRYEINDALSVIREVCRGYTHCEDGCPLYDKDKGSCTFSEYDPFEIPDVPYDDEI
jgi:hypothetical protein